MDEWIKMEDYPQCHRTLLHSIMHKYNVTEVDVCANSEIHTSDNVKSALKEFRSTIGSCTGWAAYDDSKPVLFYVPAPMIAPLSYNVIKHLTCNFSVYVLDNLEFIDNFGEPLPTDQEARLQAIRIQTIQTSGTYNITTKCAGGVLSCYIVYELEKAGKCVDNLFMIDSVVFHHNSVVPTIIKEYNESYRMNMNQFQYSTIGEVNKIVRNKLKHYVADNILFSKKLYHNVHIKKPIHNINAKGYYFMCTEKPIRESDFVPKTEREIESNLYQFHILFATYFNIIKIPCHHCIELEDDICAAVANAICNRIEI